MRLCAGTALLSIIYTVLLFILCFASSPALAATYTSAIDITNTATAFYSVGTVTKDASSNSVTTRICTQASLEFLKYAPSSADAETVQVSQTRYCPAGVTCDPSATQAYQPVPLNSSANVNPLSQAVSLITVDSSHPYHAGEVIFLRLTDGDRNLDPSASDTVKLILTYGNEKEELLLSETGVNTGIFEGYIQSALPETTPLIAGDGVFTVKNESAANNPIIARYDDECASVNGVSHVELEADALIDPFGVVFDTSNGKPVDGAKVTLMNTATEQPAVVYGDDGVSIYPATLTTGGMVQDSSGRTYSLPPGGYRFPYLQPGNYRLDVVAPGTYKAPSTLSLDQIKNVKQEGSNDTFVIDDNGSLGKQFTINPGPALHIDIPVDPITTSLWVTKTAAKSSVAIGDFLQYKITVENTSEIAVNEVVVSDRLPLGFRYRKGSAKLNSAAVADPSISEDGRTLLFTVGNLEAAASAEIKFVVEIGAGARIGKAVNFAAASGQGGATSNTARAEVQVTDELFRAVTFIVGRVFPNGCSEDQNVPGVSGVRIYLEDGTYSVTDQNGMYHFEAVKPGTHVVQLDLTSIPDGYELVACEENTRFSGVAYSQFVDVQGGSLWRADFYMKKKLLQVKGDVGLELRSALKTETVPGEKGSPTAIVLHPHFESGSADLSEEDKAQIFRVAGSLKGMSIENLNVCGHTDSQRISSRLRPVHADNYALSLARAASVAACLAEALKLSPDKIITDGKGPDEPVASNATPGGMARNRRVELRVSAAKSEGPVVKPTGEAEYEVPLQVGEAALTNLRLSIMLPAGVSYIKGTSRLGDAVMPDPEGTEDVLTYRLGDAAAGWAGKVRFDARVPLEGSEGEFVTRALLTFDTIGAKNRRTPPVDNTLKRSRSITRSVVPPMVLHPRFESGSADLSPADKELLDRTAADLKDHVIETMQVTGHTDSKRIRARLRPVYPDNHALSRARANSVAQYLAKALKLSPGQVITDGKGPDEPVASNATPEGMAKNRRVELTINAVKERAWYDLKNIKDRSGIETALIDETLEWVQAVQAMEKAKKASGNSSTTMPEFDSAWLDKAEPGTAFVWPPEGYHPPIPSAKLAVKHDPQKKLVLLVNGKEVDPLYLDGTKKRGDNRLAVSLWIGIGLTEGGNLFEAVEYSEDGVESARLSRSIHYSGPPVKAELALNRSRPVADGKTPAVIAVRLIDKYGHPAREGVVGEFKVDLPYLSYQKTQELQKNPLTTSASDWSKYQVGADGVALIELTPTTQTGEALVRFNLISGEQEVRSWLKPEDRDWILVGLAEGTVGYNTATGNMESLGDSGEDLHYYENGRLAFYAKGRVKGSWLLTTAFDSGKTPVDGRPGMYQTVDPNKYYTLYGDATEQRYDAASAKKLYVKLERDQFYALFGDYATGMTIAELSRYSRNLTGFKSEMKGEKFSYTLFASDTNQAYVKDEIRGDGTSGLYHLSRKNIVLNSETVTLVTRDRFQSEVVVSEQTLSQWLDYSIDYESGTIFFKSPVFSTDESFNPVFIVVEYESFDSSDTAWTYGGRGAVKLLGNRAELGATHVHEASTGSEGDLAGVDATVQITPETKVKAEAAATKTGQSGVSTEGSAYLAEVQHRSEKVEGKAYVRRQDQGFGLGQQAGSETGTRKVGGDVNYRITKPWTAGFELYRQETLSTGAVRDVAELKSQFTADKYSLLGGLRHAEDTLGTGEAQRSEQVYAGLTYRITERLAAQLQHDQSVGPNNNADYPTRTTVGLDYKLNEAATLFAAQEWTNGSSTDTETSRIGIKASPWTGGQLGSTVEQQTAENGARLFSTTGLKQTWQVSKSWTLDAGLDRSQTIRGTGSYDFNTDAADSSGSSEDFTALSFGAGYRQEKWSWTGRLEKRDAQTEDKLSTFMGANGDVRDGLAMAGSLQTFRTESSTGTLQFDGDLRVGLAYRPRATRVIILDRLDLIEEKQAGVDLPYDNWRVVNNFVTNLKNPGGVHLSLQYGAKYVQERIDEDDYRGYTDLMGLEGRFDITKYCDVGLRGQRLHSFELGQSLYGLGASMGFSTGRNVWLSLGYNFAGFTDRDFSKADFTAEGPFIKLRLKFDQVSAREAVKWVSGQQ